MIFEPVSPDSSQRSSHFAKHCSTLLDRISLCGGFLFVASAMGDALYGFYGLALLSLVLAIASFAIRGLNARGRHKLAAALMVLISNGVTFVCAALLGKRCLVQNFFFPAVALPIVVCGQSSGLCIVIGTLAPIILYTLLELTHYSPFGWSTHAAAPFWCPGANAAMCFAFCFLFAFEFYRVARKAEEDLRKEQNKLLAASKFSALGEMAGGIAHEINNPLSNILLLSAHIRSLASKPEIPREGLLKTADSIQDTVKRISSIIRSLSTFARNTERDPMTRVSVAKIVHETCGLCLDKFANNGVELRVSMGAGCALIECNAVQISQVLVNLLNNAYDAVQGCQQRWVQVEALERDGLVELAVMDSGPGVPRAARDRLFEPFFTTKEEGRGTGLGLSVSSNIARAHHGELSLDPSSPYTRFRLWLPTEQPKPAQISFGLEARPSGLFARARHDVNFSTRPYLSPISRNR